MSNKLYHKNFNILVLGQIISLFGSSIQRFALSLYLLDLTGSASIFATILAISMIPVVLMSPIAGILADRGDKKKLMVLLDVLSAVLLMAYAGVVFNGNDHVFIIATVMVLLSTISTICFIFVLIRFNGISECFCDDFGDFNDSSRSYFTDCWDVSGSRR